MIAVVNASSGSHARAGQRQLSSGSPAFAVNGSYLKINESALAPEGRSGRSAKDVLALGTYCV
jgi:hypothetical protein